MKRNQKIIFFSLILAALTGLYFYFQKPYIDKESMPKNSTENIPPAETVILNREGSENAIKAESKQPALVPKNELENGKMILSPMAVSTSREDSVDLEKHTYSIKNKKKEIPLSPSVTLQPGKSITIKIPGEEEVIKVQRDKIYHPDGIHMLWEKKY